MSHSNSMRIARSDPIPSSPPRFVVAGQVGTASGDVKLYEWHQAVRGVQVVWNHLAEAAAARGHAPSWDPDGCRTDQGEHSCMTNLMTGYGVVTLSQSPQSYRPGFQHGSHAPSRSITPYPHSPIELLRHLLRLFALVNSMRPSRETCPTHHFGLVLSHRSQLHRDRLRKT